MQIGRPTWVWGRKINQTFVRGIVVGKLHRQSFKVLLCLLEVQVSCRPIKIETTGRQLNKLLSRAGAQSYICKTWNIEGKLHGITLAVKTFCFLNIFMRYS